MQVVLAVLALLASCVVGHPSAPSLVKRGAAYYNPNSNGGSMLDNATYGGEPLNVIISGQSSSSVLTDNGILNYAMAVGFSIECFGFHLGGPQSANLGDGNGWVNQTLEIRQDYGNAYIGTCLESIIGGNHFRVYRQNGSEADSGALFLAVSSEEPASQNHNIVPNGYDIGRDLFVSGAVGKTKYGGVKYSTVAKNLTGLLPPGDTGVNHGIAQDGMTVLLTVTINGCSRLTVDSLKLILFFGTCSILVALL